jgi:hypothetical protein
MTAEGHPMLTLFKANFTELQWTSLLANRLSKTTAATMLLKKFDCRKLPYTVEELARKISDELKDLRPYRVGGPKVGY